jgi:Spondin_N
MQSSSRLLRLFLAFALVAVFACQKKEEPSSTPTASDTAATAAAATAPAMADTAQYTVVFTRLWTDKTHPFEYPEAGVLTGPHLSGLIGATHGADYQIYKEGTLPTAGLEKLSEEGKHSPLDQEIKDAITAGKAGALFETGPIRDAAKTESVTFTASSKFPMVSAVAMIAPSPDWFAGAADVNLMENGQWVTSKTVDMFAYDSGGDDGTTYKAPDKDNNPKKPTTAAATPHFVINGSKPPVGRLTFTKM